MTNLTSNTEDGIIPVDKPATVRRLPLPIPIVIALGTLLLVLVLLMECAASSADGLPFGFVAFAISSASAACFLYVLRYGGVFARVLGAFGLIPTLLNILNVLWVLVHLSGARHT